PARVAQLKAHPTAAVLAKAGQVMTGVVPPDRKKVIETYQSALDRDGDPEKGKIVFRKNCAACHQLDGEGHDVGQNLLATVPGKSKSDLLTAILDPNREVDARYVSYT